jgi:Reverse transcriptase (RNA-dependent DNA polymerase)/Endonuclease-reverse transcriptase
VLANNYDIVLLETSLVCSFNDEELFDARYFVFRCDRSLSTSTKKSGGGVLIAVKRVFDVSELSTKNQSLVEHECVKIKCDKIFLYISAVYLAPDVGKHAYDLFVEDIEVISDNSECRDVILVLGDFNLPKIRWKVDDESGSVMPLNVTTDLESDLIGGLFGCDLDQTNLVPNNNGTFLDLVFTNAPVDISVTNADSPLLKLDHHHKAYEIEMQVCCCKFEAAEIRTRRYIFRMADCAAIVSDLDAVDWFSLFSGKSIDRCVDLFYEMIWNCFERHVPTKFSRIDRKLPWMTKELDCLKNKKAKAAKKSKKSEIRCLEDESIDDCKCEHLREKFSLLREEYQLLHGRAYDDYRAGIEEAIKSDPKTFFGYVDLKKKRVGYPSVMHFEGRSASGPEDICDLFADFIQRTYADDVWMPSDPGPDVVQNDSPFGALQFTVDEVLSVLQDLDVNKGAGPDGIPPLILKNCASAFAVPLSLLFNRSLSTCVFPDRWKLSYVTPIFKKGRRNNVEDYRGVAILSAIPKRFELLVYRTMYDDLKNLISVNQHGFMKNRSTVTNLMEYASFVLNAIEKGWQVDSVYTDFSKAFDRVRHQLLLEEMSIGIEPARCLWLKSYLTGRTQRIRIGDAVSRDVRVTSGVPQGSHLGPLCFIWFVNRISEIFDYVRVLFYADDMKLFLPVKGFQDCMKIQSDLNKLSEWCERNSLPLNVGKCKTITFSRTRYPVEFSYMLAGTVLDRVSSINDLGVIMDEKMNFSEHVDVMVGKAFAMLGFIRRLSLEFRDPYTLKSLYMSLVRPKLEYASCIWSPFYDVRVGKVERVQRRFIRYALRNLGWTDMYDLPPYEDRCALLRLETLAKRRSVACIMLIFDILSGRVSSPNLLSVLELNTPRYQTRDSEFLRIGFHRTNYGVHEPMSAAMRGFNEVIGLFDFILTRNQFINRLKLTL